MQRVFDEQGVQDFLAFNIDMTDFFYAQARKTSDPQEKANLLKMAEDAAHEDLWHFEAVNRRGNTVDDFDVPQIDPLTQTNHPDRMARVEAYATFYANKENSINEVSPNLYPRKDL